MIMQSFQVQNLVNSSTYHHTYASILFVVDNLIKAIQGGYAAKPDDGHVWKVGS